ncbi:HtaA domain-containing protein [Solirubrobacter taibaiensis]|nr:HtaA domain-containing protein [Solirubrobacter taibaiensis]
MSLSRLVLALAVALLAVVPSAHATPAPSRATLELSAAGKRALKPLTLSSGTFTVGKATVASSAQLELVGSVRFKSGRRSVSATSLTLTVGRTSSYVSARLSRKTVRLFTVTPTRPAQLDPALSTVTLTRARIALTTPAATALRSALKLKRTPSTRSLGALSVAYKPPGHELISPPAPAPTPTTPAATATPAPTAPPTPDTGTSIDVPAGSCDPARLSATPAGSVDWFGCDLPGTRDLRSWTKYVLTPAAGCPSSDSGTIVASDGASRLIANSAYDHRLQVTQILPDLDGSVTLYLSGTITYSMPAHGIDEQITNLEIDIDPGGLTGTIRADGRSAARNGVLCVSSPEQYADETVMNLELSTTGNIVRARATVADPIGRLGGGEYPAGQPWGTFTFVDPTR